VHAFRSVSSNVLRFCCARATVAEVQRSWRARRQEAPVRWQLHAILAGRARARTKSSCFSEKYAASKLSALGREAAHGSRRRLRIAIVSWSSTSSAHRSMETNRTALATGSLRNQVLPDALRHAFARHVKEV
jgi:hypothetical protein